MNKRIDELARSVQCERHWNEEDIRKFVELILKEFIEKFIEERGSFIADGSCDSIDWDRGYVSGLSQAADIIHNHFDMKD